HTMHLIQDPIADMREQQRFRPGEAVYDPLDRARYVLAGSLVSGTTTGSRGMPVEAALAPLGLAALVVPIWRGWRANRSILAEGLVVLTALAYFVGISSGLLVNYPRYFLPTLLFGTLFSGLGLAALIRQL